jgi:hypothetical protein
MVKKLFWLVVLVIITACTVFLDDGIIPGNDPTPTAIVCENCTPIPTQPVQNTPEGTPTEISTLTLEPTATISISATPEWTPTSEFTSTPLPTSTLLVTATFTPKATSTTTKVPPTKTYTPTSIPPTATSTFTSTPTKVPTNTLTPVPTNTPTTVPTSTPTKVIVLFNVQPTTPVFMVNFVHPDEGCAWQGVAGQIFDKSGTPIKNFIVKIAGIFDGKPVNQVGITGMVSGDPYGPGSFEIVLGNKALDSVDKLTIQLFNPKAQAITNPLPFSTSSSCSENLVIINFQEK